MNRLQMYRLGFYFSISMIIAIIVQSNLLHIDQTLENDYKIQIFGIQNIQKFWHLQIKREQQEEVFSEQEQYCDSECFKKKEWVSILRDKHRVSTELSTRIVETVEEASNRYNLPSEIIMGIINVESNFKPHAESHVGARGLMQVMPNVHKNMIKKEFGETTEILWTPEENIMIGARILKEYLEMSRGNFAQALKRYNGSLGMKTKYHDKVLSAANSFGYEE